MSDRLDRIEAAQERSQLQLSALVQLMQTDREDISDLKKLVESNAKAIEAGRNQQAADRDLSRADRERSRSARDEMREFSRQTTEEMRELSRQTREEIRNTIVEASGRFDRPWCRKLWHWGTGGCWEW